METEATSRRNIAQLLLWAGFGGLAISVFYPLLRYLVPPRSGGPVISSASLPWKPGDVKAGSGRIFKFGSQPGLLIRTPAGELRAFTATCTHLNCTVQYREYKQDIWCACHNGIYDLNGRNISGPPPRPLEAYKVNVKGDQIVVARGA